ncbi:MAG: hypothetical protein KDM63_22560, partial [Verrucomicrobiae bacterium]|nr:hypothetical protein [Verrucomicrobiae bacterium]
KLYPPVGATGTQMGYSVAMTDRYLVVGEPGNSEVVASAGAVRVYDAATLRLVRTLRAPDPVTSALMGWDVAISNSVIAVGAKLATGGGPGTGAVYVFDTKRGTLLNKLIDPSGSNGDEFGAAVAVQGDLVLVGAESRDTRAGAAFLFNGRTGQLLARWEAASRIADEYFGSAVAICGRWGVVGSIRGAGGDA